MSAVQPQLAIVIPAFNEAAIIATHLDELRAWVGKNLSDISYEIIVVDDGSTDGMGTLLDSYAKSHRHIRVLHHRTNLGRGRAIRTAMENTVTDYLIALDADLSYSPGHIKLLLAPLLEGRADLTLASPYHPGGHVENVPLFRALLSRWGNRVLAHSFQHYYHTSTCIVRGYTRRLIDHLELVSTTKDLHLEVLYKTELLGFSIVEVPARLVWRNKKRGRGKGLSNRSIFKMRKAIFSHLVFNFFSKPKLLFLGPLLVLLALSLYGIGSLAFVFFQNWSHSTGSLSQVLRSTLLQGELTLTITISSLILLVIVTIFLFLASQAKKYFEESYILAARANYRMKTILKNLEDKG